MTQVVVTPVINQFITIAIDKLSRFERPTSWRRLTYAKAVRILIFQVVHANPHPNPTKPGAHP